MINPMTEIVCDTSQLAAAMQAAAPLIKELSADTSSLGVISPVQAGVLIEAKNGILSVTVSNAETSFTCNVGASEQDIRVLPPARMFQSIIRRVGKESTSLIFENQTLYVKSGKAEFKIPCFQPDGFRSVTPPESEDKAETSTELLREAILQTISSASNDKTRPTLAGVSMKHVDNDGQKLEFVATDSYALAIKQIDYSGTFTNAVVPTSTMKLLLSSLGDHPETHIMHDGNKICFRNGEALVTSRVIAKEYVAYDSLLKNVANHAIVCSKKDFFDAIRLALLIEDQLPVVSIELTENGMTVKHETEENGVATCEVGGTTENPGMKIMFNATLLKRSLETIRSEQIRIEFEHPSKPAHVFAVDENSHDRTVLTHVVMPMMR